MEKQLASKAKFSSRSVTTKYYRTIENKNQTKTLQRGPYIDLMFEAIVQRGRIFREN